MVEERTAEYLGQLKQTLETAEEICQCASCTKEREKKQMTQCEMNKIIERLPSRMIRDPPGFTTELSSNPNYWRIGRRG